MKLFNYIFLAGIVAMATSCVSDEDDLFDKSTAQRSNDAVINTTKVLESSEEGWIFNYFPGHDGMYGGVVQTVRFKDGAAYIRTQVADGVTEEYKSLYQVKAETECMISFDTYNAAFHLWSEPLGSSSTTGYESDYELEVKSISADEDTIKLKGKRYGQYSYLIRLKESGAEFMKKIEAQDALVNAIPRSVAVVKGDSIDVTLSSGILSYSISESATTEDDPEAVSTSYYDYSYITTLTGISFYEPVTINGETFQECTYDEATKNIVAVGADVHFPAIMPKGYTEYEELLGEYVVYDNGGEEYDITITSDGTKSGYYISGMTYCGGDVYASYNTAYGSFEIKAQYVGTWSSYTIWLTPYFDGSLTWDTSAGMIGTNSEEDGQTIITFKSNQSSRNITTFLEYAFTGTPSSSTAAGYLTHYADPFVFYKK